MRLIPLLDGEALRGPLTRDDIAGAADCEPPPRPSYHRAGGHRLHLPS